MIDLLLIQCKRCGAMYNGDEEVIKIKEFEQVTIIIKKVSDCDYCPRGDRTATKGNTGPKYEGWDEDAWRKGIKEKKHDSRRTND